MDGDGSFKLDMYELGRAMSMYGVELSDAELQAVMQYYDTDADGKMSYTEFLVGIRGQMPDQRVTLVKQAFDKMDVTGDGAIMVDDVMKGYDVSMHPGVINGTMTASQAYQEFIESFEGAGQARGDGKVTWEEFLTHYKEISAGIDNDEYFELVMKQAWKL